MPKNAKEGTLWTFFTIQLVAENQNNQRGRLLAASKNVRKRLNAAKIPFCRPYFSRKIGENIRQLRIQIKTLFTLVLVGPFSV